MMVFFLMPVQMRKNISFQNGFSKWLENRLTWIAISLNKTSIVVGWFLVTHPWSNSNVSRPGNNCVVVARSPNTIARDQCMAKLKKNCLQHMLSSAWFLNFACRSQGTVTLNAGAFSGDSKWFCTRFWGYKNTFYFFMHFETFVIKLRLIYFAG